MTTSKDKFCLKWNDFESNISEAFRELREDKDFFDVTLACDDDQIQAHKVILSACSPFFRKVLRQNKHEHPLLYLKGVKYVDLVSVLSFMYHGEVDIGQEDLNTFLAVAQDLKVKGLTEKAGDSPAKQGQTQSNKTPTESISNQANRKASANPGHEPPGKKSKTSNSSNTVLPNRVFKTDTTEADYDEIQEVIAVNPIKTEIEAEQITAQPSQSFSSSASSSYAMINAVQDDSMLDDFTNYEDGDQMYNNAAMDEGMTFAAGGNKDFKSSLVHNAADGTIVENVRNLLENQMEAALLDDGQKGYRCLNCNKFSKKKDHMKDHIEAHHLQLEYSCPYIECRKTCGSQPALRMHIRSHKRSEPQF